MEKAQPLPPTARRSLTQDRKYMNSFISGGLAGIVAKTVIAPMDRIKILFLVSIKNAIGSYSLFRQHQEPFLIKERSVKRNLFTIHKD